ncbi:MAG: hypothetical protein HY843_00440, partial [Bdellovibrio sp.]|nr:hypothetical protein [Bdellovibrio sp.]
QVNLLTGQKGIGKRAMVHYIAQWLFCSEKENLLSPCQKCSHCLKAQNQSWVDFIEISSSQTNENLKIEQFRNLKETLGFGAFESPFKIIHIHNAEQLTTQAANSILKLLEEPPPGWLFFVTTHDATLLLTTIVSRCQVVRLSPFSVAQIEKILEAHNTPKERLSVSAKLSQGSYEKAIKLCSQECWEIRNKFFKSLENPQNEMNALIDQCAKTPVFFELILDLSENIVEDIITGSNINYDYKNTILKLSKNAEYKLGSLDAVQRFFLELGERIFKARYELETPVNKKLLIQEVLTPWVQLA